jgi:predicted TIM-barrel fold metal-dependent hydrolase
MSVSARFEEASEVLTEHINGLRIIDTHEHLPDEKDRPADADVLSEWLTQYFSSDLVSAGLSDEGVAFAKDPTRDLMARWEAVEPFWHAARSTGYGRALDITARDIYGLDHVGRDTIGDLNAKFLEAREKGSHYRRVLKDKSRIAVSVVDTNLDCDREFFASVARLGAFLSPSHRMNTVSLGDEAGVRIHSLGDWKAAAGTVLDRWFDEKGAVGLKCGLAYLRPLRFDKVPEVDAERAFAQLFDDAHSPDWRPGIKMARTFEDHMMHFVLAWADRRGIAVQFHTGIQEGNGNIITNANPTHLTNLFLEYRNVKFDVFHMGYPYMQELSVLAKNFRNVHIDMCWGHIISPEAARRALVEWLDAVPANKISAFGGDYGFVDGVYGHQRIARENVAWSLATKVADASFDTDRAKEVACWVFFENPKRLFGLDERVRTE